MKAKIFLFMIFFASLSCKDKTPPDVTPDYSDNYKYYPLKAGYEWTYERTEEDSQGNTQAISEVDKYNADSARVEQYFDSKLSGYYFWGNRYNTLGCCGSRVLVDYSQLGCNADSVLIDQDFFVDFNLATYQYCKEKYAAKVPNYSTVKAIKTIQRNSYKDGSLLYIEQYFGYGIGLLFREEILYDTNGKLKRRETSILKSHKF